MKNKINFLRLISVTTILSITVMHMAEANSVVTQWNEVALQAIRTTHPGPTVVARALAITHTCMYDAWSAYDQYAKSTRHQKRLLRPRGERTTENKIQAISYAAQKCLTNLFPSQKKEFNRFMVTLGYNPANNSLRVTTPAGIGNIAARAVISFRRSDGSNQLGNLHAGAYSDYTNYQPVNTPQTINDPNHWQPLEINGTSQTFLTPHWGKVVPYALISGSQFRKQLQAPADYFKDPERYERQVLEILGYASHLTDEKKAIAEYWADGPASELPPGHWTILATNCVSIPRDYDLDRDVKMFFAMTNAMFDASIAVWDAKRYFDYVRPVTAVHYLFAGQTVTSWQGDVDGADWQPYQAENVVTPPFAEYISGHSAFSSAAAETLKLFTGSDFLHCYDVVPAGSSRVEPGIVPAKDIDLYWGTFSDAADEAGISRRYGGIHFVDGDLESRKLGRLIAKNAWKKTQSLWGRSI